jgi:hypothetical protein
VVAVVVVLSLALAGLLPGSHESGPGNGSPTGSTASSAQSLANAIVKNASDGPWFPLLVEGLDVTRAYSNVSQEIGCQVWSGSHPVTLPATAGNYSDGRLSTWLFGYLDANGSSLVISVTGGVATVVSLESNGPCPGGPGVDVRLLPPSAIDSSQAASILIGLPAVESFLKTNPTANVSLALVNVNQGTDGVWYAEYTSCELPSLSAPGPATGAAVMVELNATNGTVDAAEFEPSLPCGGATTPGGTPIDTSLTITGDYAKICPTGHTYAADGCTGGDLINWLEVAGSTLPFGNVLFEVQNAVSQVGLVTGTGGFSILGGSTDQVVAQTAPSSALVMTGSWATYSGGAGPATVLGPGDVIEIDMGSPAEGPSSFPPGMLVGFGVQGYVGTWSNFVF